MRGFMSYVAAVAQSGFVAIEPDKKMPDPFAPQNVIETFCTYANDYAEYETRIQFGDKEEEISKKLKDKGLLVEERKTLEGDRAAASDEYSRLYHKFWSKYPTIDGFVDPTITLRLMKQICGGEEAYERLPVLKIERAVGDDYIDFLKPEDVPHSVMRGNYNEREFLTIKARRPDKSEVKVQTLFQRHAYPYAYCYCWASGGDAIISSYNYLIHQNGNPESEKALRDLHALITKGKTESSSWVLDNKC
jgi:hypothetical protein